MKKMIRTTNSDFKIETSEILVVEINYIRFSKDERYPWVDVQEVGSEDYMNIDQVDPEESIVDLEDLKIFATNWYFNNVEVVKTIEITEE